MLINHLLLLKGFCSKSTRQNIALGQYLGQPGYMSSIEVSNPFHYFESLAKKRILKNFLYYVDSKPSSKGNTKVG